MRCRVCGHEAVYWVECKEWAMGRWRKMPTIHHYLEHRSIRFYPEYVAFYDSYEKARTVASECVRRFCKNVAVVQEITR